MNLAKDSREFIELLNSTGVEYLVVGGHAVAFHGFPRYTGDIDLLVRRSPENISRLISAFEQFGLGDVRAQQAALLEPNRIVQLGQPPNRIDILTSIDGVTFEEAWERRLPAELDGLTVSILSLKDLISTKSASGRPKDLGDLSNLIDEDR